MAEGVRYLFAETVEVAVTHVYVFFIISVIPVAYLGFFLTMVGKVHAGHVTICWEISRRSMVFKRHGKSHGQLSGRGRFSAQDIGHAVTTLLSSLPSTQNGIRQGFPGSGLDDTANVQYHHYLLTGSVKGLTNALHQSLLVLVQMEVR